MDKLAPLRLALACLLLDPAAAAVAAPVAPVGSAAPAARVAPAAPAQAASATPNPLHDPDNLEAKLLQRLDDAVPQWQRDKTGRPDWVRMLTIGVITPRAGFDDKSAVQPLDLDIVMRNTKQMPWVKFPHRPHTEWLDCVNCHDAIFVAKAGANEIDMTRIFRGEFCGVCHGRVAFQPFEACQRCHSLPQPGSAAWWITR